MKAPECFTCGIHLRWDGVWQRPHHLLTRLAQRVPVVVIEEPFPADADRDELLGSDELRVIRPLRRRGWGAPFVDAQAAASARAIVGDRRCGVWLYTPMMNRLIDEFAAAPVVYDVMDDLAEFDFAPAGMAAAERALLERADVVFTGGPTLYENRKHAGAKVHCHPSGVEFERFAADVAPHPVIASLRGPTFLYVGVIDERLDYAIVAALADAFPGGSVVLAGPVVKVDPARLVQRPNVHYTGRLPYAALPSLLAGADVALMPFAINRATTAISPTKTLEYFAAGRPVVSTPVHDVVQLYGDVAYIASGPQDFVDAVRDALAAPPQRLERGVAVARAHAWDAIFAKMWAELHRRMTKREPIDVARALRFLRQLAMHNERPWFAEHRAVWDEHVKPEWEDTVAVLLATATAFDERFAFVDPRSCLFRLARDTRFAKDKTPYKTWVSAWLSPFGKHGSNPGFYVQLCPGRCLVAAGIWDPAKEALHALRQHFSEDDARGFDRILAAKRLAPYLPLETDSLRVTPRGFPKDHPRRDLVRARRYIVRRVYPDADLARAGALATFRAAMRDLAPFVAYLERIVRTSNDRDD